MAEINPSFLTKDALRGFTHFLYFHYKITNLLQKRFGPTQSCTECITLNQYPSLPPSFSRFFPPFLTCQYMCVVQKVITSQATHKTVQVPHTQHLPLELIVICADISMWVSRCSVLHMCVQVLARCPCTVKKVGNITHVHISEKEKGCVSQMYGDKCSTPVVYGLLEMIVRHSP